MPHSLGRKLFLIALSLVIATAIVISAKLRRSSRTDRQSVESPARQLPKPRASFGQPAPEPAAHDSEWDGFRRKFGEDLRGEFTSGGHLTAVDGSQGNGARADRGFNPADPKAAITRAKEILDTASALLGVRKELPLVDPIYQGDSIQAKVYFREELDGLPVMPYGNVTVNLGANGELLSLSSTYIPAIRVTNSPKLGIQDAQERALAEFPDTGSAFKAEGGTRVIWIGVPRSEGHEVEGRHAYEFMIQGRQVIVDAASGAILLRRDRRVF